MKSCGNPLLRTGLVLSAALFCTTGCKTMSGWKLPFSGREPDADKLAARADTITPTSPATKHSPSAIASAAANPPKSTMTPTTGSTTSTASYPGSTPGLLGNSSSPTYTPSNPSGGLAATANGYTGTAGYQTGPYNTSNKSGTAGSLTSAGLPNSGGANPYGAGTYTGVSSTTAPNITNNGQLPTSNQPMANNLGGVGATGTGNSLQGTSGDYPAIPGGYTSPSTPNYPGYGNVNTATATGSGSQVGSTAQAGSLPAVSAYQSATPASAYAPGTTGRDIRNYNFSSGTGSSAPGSTTPPATYGGQTYGGQTYGGQTYGGQTYGGQTYSNQPYGNQPYGGQTQSQSFSLPRNTASGEPLLVR